MRYGEFLSHFFFITKFNRNYIFSTRISKEEVRQRRCLIYCLHLLGYQIRDIMQITNKSRSCIIESIKEIGADEKMLAEQIIISWRKNAL